MKNKMAVLILGSVLALVPAAGQAAQQKPNIIVIFTDDHGYADLGGQQIRDDIRTPNIDALIAGGVRMTNGYVTAPQCVPSRAGLMTGRYQNRFGVESNKSSLEGFNGQRTIAERLREAGYATGMTGKWHLGPISAIVDHGFDDVFAKSSNRPGWANFDLEGNRARPGPEHSGLYHLDANTEAAKAFIQRHHREPFFFYLAYRAPHVPLDPPEKYLKRFPGPMPERRRKALAMLSAVDDGVGAILATLRQLGLEEKTLIFLIGDNGAPLKIHKLDAPGGGPGWDGSLNDPLNGEKGMLTEGGIRVPFVVYWKNHLPSGLVYNEPVISLDVAATAVACAGLPHDPTLDGINLLPRLEAAATSPATATGPAPRTLYWRWIAQAAVREGKWKYLRAGGRQYLFDLSADKEEKHNVLANHPEIAERLQAQLERWAGQLQPPGLETGPMSQVWQQYYDYYLEGKPAPPVRPARQTGRQDNAQRIQGWVVRGGRAELADGALQIRPTGRGDQKVFIAASNLRLPPGAIVTARLRTFTKGKVQLAWRHKSENEFLPQHIVALDCNGSGQWQELTTALPAKQTVIHMRVVLPPGGADIERIELHDPQRKLLRAWHFATGPGQPAGKHPARP